MRLSPQFSLEQTILEGFADHVILPSYAHLAQTTATLAETTAVLAADLSEAHLTAAQQAWGTARLTWSAA